MTREELRKKRKELAESKGYAGFIPYSQRQKQAQQQVQQPVTQPTTQPAAQPVTQPINNNQFAQRVNELYAQNMQMTSLANTTRQLHTVNRSSNLGFASQYGGTNGNIDINNRKVKQNNDGSISTEKSITITETDEKGKDKHIVIPTVIDGKRPDDDDEAARIAIEHYEKTGENLGKFSNLDDANKFAEDLSKRQGIYYDNKNTNPLLSNLKSDSTEPLKNITKKEAKKQIKESNKLVKELKREEYDKVQEEREAKYQEDLKNADNIPSKIATATEHTISTAFQKPRALYDGFQASDIVTIPGSTVVGAAAHTIEGVKSVGDAVANTGAYGVASIADIAGAKGFSKRLVNAIKANEQQQREATDKVNSLWDKNSLLGKSGNQAFESTGQSSVFGALGSAGYGKAAGGLTFSMGASGGFSEAYNDENTKGWEAALKAAGSGAASYVTENMFDWMGYGGNKITKGLKEKIGNMVGDGIASGLARLGFSAVGEGAEEIAEEVLNKKVVNALINKVISENKYDTSIDISETVANALVAMFSVAGSGAAPTIAYSRYQTQQQAAPISESEAISQIIREADLNQEEKKSLERFAERNSLNAEQVESLIQNNAQEKQNQIEQDELNELAKGLTEEQAQEILNGESSFEDKITQIDEKKAGNERARNLFKSIDEYNNSRKEGEKVFDINDENTRKEIESIQKIAQDRGINITFDESRFNNSSDNAFYEYDEEGNVANIVLNPNATTKKYVQNLTIHELVHSFGGKEKSKLMKTVLDYAYNLSGSDPAYQDLKNAYVQKYGKNVSESIIEEEAVANILGEKLGDKQFVNDLINGTYNKDKTLLDKIYDFVKNQINRFRGYKDQEQYWTHVKELFDDAYRNSEINSEGLKNSVEANKMTNIKDSQGRQLSKGQVNYFKDSKVRDKDGNLLEVYHGTPTGGFTVYDNSKLGSTTGALDSGLGIHFTNNPDMASIYKDYVSDEALNGEIKKLYEKYGKDFDSKEEFNRDKIKFDREHSEEIAEIRERLYKEQEGKGEVKKQYINITKPLSVFADYGIDNKQLADDWVYALTGSTDITDTTDYYEDNEEFLDAIQSNWNNELAEAKDELATPEAKERLQELGYDGLILPLQNTDVAGLAALKTQGGEEFKDIQLDGNEYIVFNSNQAKNTDNLNPSENPDIRYSSDFDDIFNMSDEELKNRIQENEGIVQGLENRTKNEIKEITNDYIKQKLEENGYYSDDIEIIDSEIHGSRNRGTAREDSDLDVVVEYDGDIREDDLFNMLNDENPLYIDGIKVDINPITADRTGTLQEYMEESNKYDQKILTKMEKEKQATAGNNYVTEGKSARFTDDRLNYIIRGSINEFSDNYARSYVAKISPEQFLQLTSSPEYRKVIENESTELNPEQLKGEPQNIFLYVDMKTGQVTGHEGRHRMVALQKAGIENVDIEIIPDSGTYNRSNAQDYDNLYISGQRDEFNTGTTLHNVLAVTKNNVEKIKQEYLGNENKGDIRFSKDVSGAWNNFIEKNFKNTGEGTAIQDLKKLPTKKITIDDFSKVLDNYKNIPQADKQAMLKDLENINLTKESLDEFKNTAKLMSDTYSELEQDRFKSKSFDNEDRKKLIAQKRNEFNKDYKYDDAVIDELDSIIPRNRNGRRTVENWKRMAKEIGVRIADLSPEQIEDIAVKSYYDLEPSKNITQYDKGDKKSFEKLYANDWVNEVFEGVRENRQFAAETSEKAEEEVKIPKQKKTLNPTEIANLKLEDASTTPTLPDKKYKKGDKQSQFVSNINDKVGFLTDEEKQAITSDENVQYYASVTNAETMAKAYKDLQENGKAETESWYAKKSEEATADDVAKGWILLKQYKDSGNTQGMVNVAKKLRDMGTKAGQTVQAFNIMSRLTPEGMVAYTQGELQDAYNNMVQGKTKKWIDQHKGDFDLSQEEIAFIMDTMQNLPPENPDTNNYERKVALGQIQKLFTDKIPTDGNGIKAWMRISMLFNPKTQVRNVAGNAAVIPVNMFSDFLGSKADKLISKYTGLRTLGNPNVKSYLKGMKDGFYQSYNDFRLGINTRDLENNKFEFGDGKAFKNKGIGKALNRVDNILNFVMDFGDRGFSQAAFVNSINNQMVLNNVTQPTQEMIDIATNEALSRTWNDSNDYTRLVLSIRGALNKIGTKNYGLGDVLIPFAKTPANLTKAIVDYSPVGLAKSILNIKGLKNAIETGQITPKMQHEFVDRLGKGLAGSLLYVAGYALAKAGITSGEPDDDKDVKNFMRNSLGIAPYSIKIGDKTFTYDWSQPIATPLAIMANYEKMSKDNPDAKMIDKVLGAVDIGTNQLLEQSFMESINEVLNGNGTVTERVQKAIFDLPARAIPTFSKQVADLVDGTQRTTFEYNNPTQSAINSAKAKLPGLSKTLTPSIDTLGNEIQKYGGENNWFNVFFNPANMNKGEKTKAGQEIYDVYMATGDTTVFPVTAPYYVNRDGGKITMDSKQRARYQKVSGDYAEQTINKLLNDPDYNKLEPDDKAEIISKVVTDSKERANKDVLNITNKSSDLDVIDKVGADYYTFKLSTKGMKEDVEMDKVLKNKSYSNKNKQELYGSEINSKDKAFGGLKQINSNFDMDSYLDYKINIGTFKGDDKKEQILDYLSGLDMNYDEKLYLYGQNYKLNTSELQDLENELLSKMTTEQAQEVLSTLRYNK